ncbi:hypothetical protein AAG906_013589 [Vitis piasezkii]
MWRSTLFKAKSILGLTHWQSPNFFGYFQANASTAGFLGEMLCTGLNVVGFNWIASPAATELESIVMDWVGKMLMLPPSFLFSGGGGSVFHGSTCEAILCSLAAPRDKVLKKIGHPKITKLVVYGSDQTHSTVQKASKLVGIPTSNFRSLPTSFSNDFALCPDDVHTAMENIGVGLVPLFLCATVGTTSSGAVDPLEALGHVAKDFKVWLHIDAAYAGSACICPEFRPYLNGVELADSISITPTNGSSPTWTTIVYGLKNQIYLHGLHNLMFHIRSNVNLAKRFEAHVAKDPRFEVVVSRRFALVCFRLRPKQEGRHIAELKAANGMLTVCGSSFRTRLGFALRLLQELGFALEEAYQHNYVLCWD